MSCASVNQGAGVSSLLSRDPEVIIATIASRLSLPVVVDLGVAKY